MSHETTIVVIEDEPSIADLLDLYLRQAGYRVLLSPSGEHGLQVIRREQAAMALIDVGLPGIDGFEVLRVLRAASDMPVMFITARDSEMDRLEGLALGADDYVVKPFSPREVVARVRAILRRGQPAPAAPRTVVEVGEGLLVDLARREVTRGGEVVAMATREFDLLANFAANQGIALSRRQLIGGVWGADWYGDDRTVDVHVRQLRKKLGDDLPLATVWGIGYRLG